MSTDPPAFDPGAIFAVLERHAVDFVLVGGLAGMAHGSSYPSFDVDVAYERSPANLERMAAALRKLGATLRGAPPDLPFQLDAATLANGMHFTFDTRLGPFDILGEPDGARDYAKLSAAASSVELEGVIVKVASLDHLIAMKRAANRPKDRLMVEEYIRLSDETSAADR